jgi:hypothetical protein
MKKIFYTFFVYIFLFFIKSSIFAASIPVENIFSDIDVDYKYYNELQYLYDKWMIFPDENWRFNPNKLLDRDEFFWIMMEVSCEKCISPNTSYSLINKYGDKDSLFFDVNKNNKYFYCISEAENSWYVKWYQPWTTCENWVKKENEIPFCPNNVVTLEEAISTLLISSNILDENQFNLIKNNVLSWEINEYLSDDVWPFNLDESFNEFYPYFKKAIWYNFLYYDNFWNEITRNLIEIVDNKIYPKQSLNREKFLVLSYILLKENSCNTQSKNNIWLNINIHNKVCNINNTDICSLSNLSWNEKIFDFNWLVFLPEGDNITNEESYIWRFYNFDNWEQIIKYWKYIDDYEFLNNWNYRIFFRVITDNWNTWEVFTDINFSSENALNNKLNIWILNNNSNYKFRVIFSNINEIKNVKWFFWDWKIWYWLNAENFYTEKWVYEIKLIIETKSNIFLESKSFILIWNEINFADIDTDWDWIPDTIDLCPTVPWPIENKWCPIFEDICIKNEDCKDWFFCNYWSCSPRPFSVWCEYSWWDLIYWNAICNSCPCNNYVDFNSILRKCDIIIPVITSPNEEIIYSKWNYFQVR